MSGRDPSQLLTLAYITAFAIIALLTLASHALTTHITHKQRESAEVLQALGKQRGYVQQISYYSTHYYDQGQQIDYDLLVQALEGLKESHRFVKDMIDDMDSGPNMFVSPLKPTPLASASDPALQHDEHTVQKNVLYRIYYTAPFYLDSEIQAFISEVEKFLQYDKANTSKERQKSRDYISSRFTRYFVPSLDAALEGYQEETLEKITLYYHRQVFSVLGILFVLFIEAAFIFNPLVRHLRRFHKMLHTIAMTDPLTGLKNRRAFTADTQAALNEGHRNETPLVVALTDLDKFKNVNDTYGHDVGDKVLQHFSEILRTCCREGDIIGRIGGEEFALVLPKTGKNEGEKVLERIRQKIEKTPCTYTDENGKPCELTVTVSVGFVLAQPGKRAELDALLKKADDGLYTAKEQGRNRVIFVPNDA
ncbi:MAG: GGDEF domain-containing protein [Alphaproteobacteria bacterium]|nr:GGDEF domain-containing protein [Alphaproteobacteria bacterium]